MRKAIQNTKKKPKMAPSWSQTGGGVKEKFRLFRTSGALGLQMDDRSSKRAPGEPKVTKMEPNVSKIAPKWTPKSIKLEPKPNKKTLRKMLKNWRAFCPSHDRQKKPAHRETRRTPSTHPPINQSTKQPIEQATDPPVQARWRGWPKAAG